MQNESYIFSFRKAAREIKKHKENSVMMESFFKEAKSVWFEGHERDVNTMGGFHCFFQTETPGAVHIRIAAMTIYRLFLNGIFMGYGPARAAHDYYRVDEWPLSDKMISGRNSISIEVVGYNIKSYAYLDQPSFLQAEILDSDGRVLGATGTINNSFVGMPLPFRKQNCDRYSSQRTFCEIYRLKSDFFQWRLSGTATPAKLTVFPEKRLLPRGVSYPTFNMIHPVEIVEKGIVKKNYETVASEGDGELLREMKSLEMQREGQQGHTSFSKTPVQMPPSSFMIFSFAVNLTGFIGFSISCKASTRVLLVFDEIMVDSDVLFKRQSSLNVIACDLTESGDYLFESIEPYVMKHVKLIVMNGECTVNDLYIREYANPDADNLHFDSGDRELNMIFEAGRQSLRQNALDLFMDCPGRERAGWIGDTYYTAKAAAKLFGNLKTENNQFENYTLPEKFPDIPEGVLPMCYPSEHPTGRFIPTFCFWFVLQLEEYAARGGNPEVIEKLRPRVIGLFQYFEKFKNEFGLLESLPSWVFIEWSAAAKFVQDLSIPANTLYLRALKAAGRLYNVDQFLKEAESLGKTIVKLAFTEPYFIDNLVRENGCLLPTSNHSEICQYLAFAADLASPETHAPLWNILLKINENPREELHKRNVLFGECLRLELLARYGLSELLLKEIRRTFYPMALRTGTLWEKYEETVSCNHGFTSYIAYLLYIHADRV